MSYGGSGKFWDTDFENQCYKGKFGGFQPRFDISSFVFSQIGNSFPKSCLKCSKAA